MLKPKNIAIWSNLQTMIQILNFVGEKITNANPMDTNGLQNLQALVAEQEEWKEKSLLFTRTDLSLSIRSTLNLTRQKRALFYTF